MSKVLPPLLITIVLTVVAALSLWAREAWLVPSVAAAAFLQVFSPDQPAAQPYSIAVGQIIGGIAGFIGVLALGTAVTPAFAGDHLLASRFGAIVIAIAITSVAQVGLKATNPAGGATAVVVASGLETATWLGAGRLLIGIALVTVLGEVARRIVLRTR